MLFQSGALSPLNQRVPARNLAAPWLPIGPNIEGQGFFRHIQNEISLGLDKNFKTSRTPFIFHQIQHPGAVLNVELHQLFKTAIGIKIWPIIDREMTV